MKQCLLSTSCEKLSACCACGIAACVVPATSKMLDIRDTWQILSLSTMKVSIQQHPTWVWLIWFIPNLLINNIETQIKQGTFLFSFSFTLIHSLVHSGLFECWEDEYLENIKHDFWRGVCVDRHLNPQTDCVLRCATMSRWLPCECAHDGVWKAQLMHSKLSDSDENMCPALMSPT